MYELDLKHLHMKELREFLAPYLDAAHTRAKLPRRALPKPSLPTVAPRSTTIQRDKDARAQIREWARGHGFEVGNRGFINPKAVQAFQVAHPGSYIPASTLQYTTEMTHA